MRPDDWVERLFETVERHRGAPFAWGAYDCATLVRDAALALGAADPFDGEAWDGVVSALRSLKRKDAYTVRQFMARKFLAVTPALAQRGDVGFTADEHPLMCPAVIIGAEAVSRNETGWIVLPRTLLVDCYRIG